jgi:hypothetical protein
MAGLQALGRRVGRGGGAGGHPLPAVNVHVADQIAGDGRAAVVLRRQPAQLDVLGADLVGHEVARLGGHVEDVDVGRGLEGAGLAGQLDGVAAGVPSAIRLNYSRS